MMIFAMILLDAFSAGSNILVASININLIFISQELGKQINNQKSLKFVMVF